jgi:Protein of unknown function (DUF1565)
VTATNSAGSATATSAATAVVNLAPSSTLGTKLPARMPESSGSKTLYVAATGSDSNAGTLVAPFKTLSKAFAAATDGTIIDVRAGVYGPQSVSNARFSPSNPVTVQSYPGETATFVGASTFTNAVTLTNDQGIRIRKITIAAPSNCNLKIVTSQHIEVDQIVSKNAGRSPTSTTYGYQGILVAGYPVTGGAYTYSDDIQIWNSRIFDDGATTAAQHDHGIYMCSAGGYTAGEAGCRSFVIANNVIYSQETGHGIQLGDDARGGFIVNNTIDNTYRGTSYSGCGIVVWGGLTSNDLIVNNIFSNSAANAVCASLGKNAIGNVVRNNLSFNNTTSCDWCRKGIDYDPVYGSYTGFTVGTNVPDANPLYVDRANSNFHLQAGSPARGKADPAYTPPRDADGNARSSGPALGAFG